MKLALKITVALLVVFLTVFSLEAVLRLRWVRDTLQTDMLQDHVTLGRALAAAVAGVWRNEPCATPDCPEGEARARDLINDANRRETTVHFRLLNPESLRPEALPQAARAAHVESVIQGQEVTFTDPLAGRRNEIQRSYIPVFINGRPRAAIELSESLAMQNAYMRLAAARSLGIALAMVAVCTGLALALGYLTVGKRVGQLVEKARRVGRGDLTGPLTLRQRDEIGQLAREIDVMTDRLAEARDRVEAETRARMTALEQLRHADRLSTVGTLASGLAHELGTPLNVVGARATMILSGDVTPEEIPENTRIIAEQAERMARIIRELLDFARRREPEKTRHDLVPLARRTLELLTPMAKKHRVGLALEADDAALCAEVDGTQIQQALTNMIVNGIQAMPDGGRLAVELRRRRMRPPVDRRAAEGEYLCLAVGDEGSGIPATALEHVFDPFYTTKDVGHGTGLGLSVAYGIIHEHDGWIEVQSEPGRGSRFTICLPPSPETA